MYSELVNLTVEELKLYKQQLLDEMQKIKTLKRQIDVVIKRKLEKDEF